MAEYRPKGRGLERVLGTGALFSTAYGNVGSSIYYALGLVAIYAAGATPLVFVIAGLIFAATAATYAEATTMYPEAGGSASFSRRAFNEFWSFFAGWGQMLTYIVTISISAFFVPHYLGVFWEPLGESPADIIGGILIVVTLGVLNVVGVQESAGVNVFFAIADFLTQVLLVVIGVVLVLDPDLLLRQIDFGSVPTLSDFLIAIPVGMVAYTGIETISNMAEEARDYKKTIPRGIGLVVGAVAVIYVFLPAIALSVMPVRNGETALAKPQEQGGFADDPILGVVENIDLGPLQGAAEVYVGVLAATILFIATNAGLLGVSRLTYSMGQHRQLPEGLRKLHPRFRTPYVAIALFGTIACLAIVPGQADFLGTIYAFGAMLSFTMAHGAVAWLRYRHPEIDRPWKSPFTLRLRGREIPLLAVLGGVGTGIAFVVVTVLDVRVLISGVIWLTIGVTGYVLYRRNQRLPLTETRKVVLPEARRGARGRVRVRARRLRGRPLQRGRRGHRRPPGREAPPRHPHPGDDHRAGQRSDRRRDARAGGQGGRRGGLGARARRAPGHGPLGEGAGRRGRPAHPRGGEGDPGSRDSAERAAQAGGRLAVGAHRRDRPLRPSLPRDHRLHARRGGATGSREGGRSGLESSPCSACSRA